VAAGCRACGERFGEYFCEPCRFYDDDTSKGQFHCVGCGLCRVGGRENYFHCQKCVACLPLQVSFWILITCLELVQGHTRKLYSL